MHPNAQQVQESLALLGSQSSVVELASSTRSARDAAAAIGTTVAQIAKSLIFVAEGEPILVIASGSDQVDLGKLGDLLGRRMERPAANTVKQLTGFPIGGVPPIGLKTAMRVFVDRNLCQHAEIWAAAGTPHAVFRTTPDELVRITGGDVVDVRGPTRALNEHYSGELMVDMEKHIEAPAPPNRGRGAAPATDRVDLERRLTRIMERILGAHLIDVRDDFFDLGMRDAKLWRFLNEIERSFHTRISFDNLLKINTIDKLADAVFRQAEGLEGTSTAEQRVEGREPGTSVTDPVDPVPTLSRQELRELQVGLLHTRGRRLGPRSFLVEVEPGDPGSRRPFFYLGWGLDNCPGTLGKDQAVYYLPVLTRARSPATFIRDLAALYVEEIRAVQPEGPYLLGGACFGAWPALEIAQQLQSQGQRIALLFILDSGGPDRLYQRCQRLTHHWRNLRRLSPAGRLRYLLERGRRVLRRMTSRNNDEIVHCNDDYKGQLLDTVRLACKAYRPRPYSGKVALFFAREGDCRSSLFPRGGWGKTLTGEVDVHVVPGDHTHFLEYPNVLVLVEKMKNYLDNIGR